MGAHYAAMHHKIPVTLATNLGYLVSRTSAHTYAMETLLNIAAIVIGTALLAWGADRFIDGAASIAKTLNVPSLLIGLTLVAMGTSAPEILVSAVAAVQGNTGLAIGNALGSNITNIGLVIGLTAIVVPITVRSKILRNEMPILAIVSLLAAYLLWDKILSLYDAYMLLGGLILLLAWLAWTGIKGEDSELTDSESENFNLPVGKATVLFIIGMICLLGGSQLLVWGAVNIATELGVSDTVIGLTIVAFGTSLPELAASLGGALKKEHDIAIGNVVGSNLFNLLAVLGVAGAITPAAVDDSVISTDIPLMLVLTAALIVMSIGIKRQGRINRFEASLLLVGWLGWQAWTWTGAMA